MDQVPYTVTAQAPGAGYGGDGKPTRGVDVTIVTPSGGTRTVFIPESQYRVDLVRERLTQEAATMEEIFRLGS